LYWKSTLTSLLREDGDARFVGFAWEITDADRRSEALLAVWVRVDCDAAVTSLAGSNSLAMTTLKTHFAPREE
jgi:hypothetical protein